MSTSTGPLPTANAVPPSTAAAGVVSLPAMSFSWLASTPQPISPAMTSTATTATDVHSVTARRFSRALCSSTIRLAAVRSFVPLPITFPHHKAVQGEPGPRPPQQDPCQDQKADVAGEIPGVLRRLPGAEFTALAEAAAVDLEPAGPPRDAAG